MVCFLQLVFDMQLLSIKNFPAAAPSTKLDVHPVTARYAQLTASLLLLNADYQVRLTGKCLTSQPLWYLVLCRPYRAYRCCLNQACCTTFKPFHFALFADTRLSV